MTNIYSREEAKASDRKLVELMTAEDVAERNHNRAVGQIHDVAGDRRDYRIKGRPWGMPFPVALDAVAKRAQKRTADTPDEQSYQDYLSKGAADVIYTYETTLDALETAQTDTAVQRTEWFEHGQWSRYIAVPGGHIHAKEGCFTLRWDTTRFWLPELSGDTEADAVEAYGEVLCTHCFPTAPVGWIGGKVETTTDGRGNVQVITKAEAQAIRDAKQAEKQAKLDAKNAKRVIDPQTGDDVLDGDGRPLKTEVAVRNAILGLMEDIRYYGPGPGAFTRGQTKTEVVDRLVEALAAKQGRPQAEVRAEFQAKADRKYARR